MSKQPERRPPTERARTWIVIAVFDPDGTGQDFGYTVGLADLGHPELHMWARPTDGIDPGHDFKLSSQDIGMGLSHYADLLLAGDLDVGSDHEVAFDGGLTSATFTVGSPVSPGEVDAFQVRAGATVLPLRWVLHREPEGESLPVAPEVAESIEALARDWQTIAAEAGVVGVSARPRVLDEERFGPWSPVIEAVRDAVRMVGSQGDLSWCIDDLSAHRHEIGHQMATAAALARRHGRSSAFDNAKETGTRDGHNAVTVADSLFHGTSNAEIRRLRPEAQHAMGVIVAACYSLLVVREFLDESVRSLVHDAVRDVCVGADLSSDAWFDAG